MSTQPIEQLLAELRTAQSALDSVRAAAQQATHEAYPNKPALERAAQLSDDAHDEVVEAVEHIEQLLHEMEALGE